MNLLREKTHERTSRELEQTVKEQREQASHARNTSFHKAKIHKQHQSEELLRKKNHGSDQSKGMIETPEYSTKVTATEFHKFKHEQKTRYSAVMSLITDVKKRLNEVSKHVLIHDNWQSENREVIEERRLKALIQEHDEVHIKQLENILNERLHNFGEQNMAHFEKLQKQNTLWQSKYNVHDDNLAQLRTEVSKLVVFLNRYQSEMCDLQNMFCAKYESIKELSKILNEFQERSVIIESEVGDLKKNIFQQFRTLQEKMENVETCCERIHNKKLAELEKEISRARE